jgi:rod shape-determining protein MreC
MNKSIELIDSNLKKYILLKNSHIDFLKTKEEIMGLKLEIFNLKRELEKKAFIADFNIRATKYLVADLILIDLNFPLNNLLINKGHKDSIKKNMTVVNMDGDLVGKIVEPITSTTSRVRLITSSIGGAGAYLKSNKLEGFLTGSNKKICRFKYIIENKSVEKGDIILTSGTDNIFPAYIPIGMVVEIKDDYLEKEVLIEPFFIKKSIKHLAVLKDE